MNTGFEKRVRQAFFILSSAALIGGCSNGPTLPYTGQNPTLTAKLALSGGTTFDYGNLFIDGTEDHIFTLTNTGNGPATGINSQFFVSVFAYKGGSYPGTGGTCGATLAAGASCSLVVTYTAAYQSTLTEVLTVNYSDGSANQILSGPTLMGKAIYGATSTLDTTFSSTGEIATPVGPSSSASQAVVVQSNGLAVTAGWAFDGTKNDFALARYNNDGTLDTTFGNGGTVIAAIGSGDDFGRAMTLQSNGQILVAGWSQVGGVTEFAVARFNSDGSLDPSFGSGGKVLTAVGSGNAYGEGIAIQANNDILVAGYTTNSTNHSFALVRYNPNGTLDATFGTGGILTPPVGTDDYGAAVAVQQNGQILMAGTTTVSATDTNFALIRLNQSGAFDTSFGANGTVTTDIGTATLDHVNAMMLQPDGRILVAGSSSSGGGPKEFAMIRYTGAGALDSAFAASGKLVITLGLGDAEVEAVGIQTDGKIVMGGYSSAGGAERDFALVRVSASGVADPLFGTNGQGTYSFGSAANIAYGLAIQPSAKILLAGGITEGATSEMGIVRVWP